MSAKQQFVVACVKHGKESKDWAGKQVVVQRPATKKQQKEGGCPLCRAESAEVNQ